MSSTRNSQNVLVNILRPTYYFDGSGFTSGVVVSNVKTVAAATVRTDNLDIGDPGCNIYLGAGAGTSWATNTTNTSNTALGLNAASGISNVSNSVFIGSGSGAGLASANSTIVVGTGVGVYGSSNTILGSRNVVIGSNNVVIGSDICLNDSYKLNIGNLIVGDICLNQGLRFTTNVVIEGTVECAAFNAGALDTSNLVVPGYIRNAGGLTVATMDLSGGNFRFTGLGVSRVSDVSFYQGRVDASWGIRGTGYDLSSGFILTGDVSANRFIGAPDTSNYIGGVTLNSSNLSLLGTITGVTDNTSNKIGGVTLSNTNISYAGALVGSTNNTSNKVGGVTLSNTNISYAGTITGSTDNTSNKIGGVTLSNTNISYAGTIIGSTDNTSNSIGGVVLSNGILQASRLQDKLGGAYFDIQSNQIVYAGRLSNADATQSNSIGGITLSNNILAASVIRNALSSATIDMSGGNISNAGTHTSSNFIGTSSASNSIGGVTLSNTNISYAGTITGSTDNTSNKIGGVTLSNTNITTTGIINGTNAAQSNSIGGVTLWNNNVSNSGTTTSSNFSGTSTASNNIGGVTLSNTNITYAGAITGSTDAASNKIGGVTLSNTGIVYAGAISNSVINQSNSIGGVTLSNGYMRAGVGSATAPGISFGTDTDTGVFGSTNVLGFATNGTERAQINASGNVGIGTSSLSNYRLSIKGSGGSNGFIVFHNSGNDIPFIGIGYDESSDTLQVKRNNGASDFNQTPPLVIRRTTGNIAINHPFASDYLLDISGLAKTKGLTFSVGNVTAGDLTNGAPSYGLGIPNYNIGGLASPGISLQSYYGLSFMGGDTPWNAGQPHMVITKGKVGIGTTNPGNLLDICSSAATAMVNLVTTVGGTGGANGVAYYSSNMTSGTLNAYITGKNTSPSNSGAIRYTHVADGSVSNYIAITGAGASGINVLQDGRVGIGTTNPQFILDVSSATTSQGIGITAPNATLNLRNAGSANTLQLYSSGTAQGLYTSSNFIQISTNGLTGNNGLCVSGNRLGIATQTPGTMLDINMPSGSNGIRVYGGNYPDVIVGNGGTRSGQMIYDIPTAKWVFRANDTSATVFENPANTERMRIDSNGNVGIGTSAPVYKLDVGATAGTASVNMSTWPRNSVSNVCIIRGVAGSVGNTINFSNAGVQNTIDTNLMTVVQSNGTTGASFKFLKSGVWAINAWFSNSTAGILYWMDVSTNDNSNVAYLTAGNPIVTLQQAGGGSVGIYFTGWLPGSSTNVYKFRFNSGTIGTGNNYYMQAMLLYETPSSAGTFPY